MRFSIATATVLTIVTITLGGTTGAWAQKSSKAHKKPAVVETNRVVRSDYGISYIIPDGYLDHPHSKVPAIRLEGPRTSSFVSTGRVNEYVATSIDIIRYPIRKERTWDSVYTADEAKGYLESLNKAGINDGNPLNYQNSAKIEVAGHPALAILCETSFSGTSDRAIARLVVLRHRGNTYLFIFQALDAEFETRVPSFEKFMGSLKFLQPNVEPADDKPAGPINIEISK